MTWHAPTDDSSNFAKHLMDAFVGEAKNKIIIPKTEMMKLAEQTNVKISASPVCQG